ncbi:hypothetical protein VI817_009331 [Penicillium citrinum]|nr:hypothetical protein VI817_009331 [Penicillium citrinum]
MADSVKFKRGKEEIMNIMKLTPSFSPEKMVEIIENFPSQMKAIASQLSSYNEGPFPLDHDDFLPWELIGFPRFLSTLPACLGLPENYDQHGQPLDEEEQETWRERGDYVVMVKSLEHADNLLSTGLSSKRMQTTAYAYRAYTCTGKLGTYDRVIEELTRQA